MSFITIDGPGGSGKSTVARALAAHLGWERLDTGAMYRAVALGALRRKVDAGDEAGLTAIARAMDLEVGESVRLDGEDVTTAIRSAEVDAIVSSVAQHPEVRRELVRRQQAWVAARDHGVLEGRDTGSVVVPDADLKVYLTARQEVRARRRGAQQQGQSLDAHSAALAHRDRTDAGRADSPLVVPEGALVVDSSDLEVDEVVDVVLVAFGERRAIPADVAEVYGQAPRLEREAPRPGATARAQDHDASPTAHGDAGSRHAHKAGHASEAAGEGAGLAFAGPKGAPGRGELAFYACCRAIAVGVSHLYLPGPVIGAHHVPAEGPFILAPTHRSYVDWLVAARVTRRRLRYLVKEEVWHSRAAGRLLEALGAFPVQRGSADRRAFARALEVLRAGEPLVVFPEGTRRDGGRVEALQEGAAYLALRAQVPIVPVALGGTERSMPRGAPLPRPARVRLVVGEPLWPRLAGGRARPAGDDPPSARSGRVSRQETRALSEELRARLEALLAEAEGRSVVGE